MGITMEYAAYSYVAAGSGAVKIVASCKHEKEARAFLIISFQGCGRCDICQILPRPARMDAETILGLPPVTGLTLLKDLNPSETNALQKELFAPWRELVLSKK